MIVLLLIVTVLPYPVHLWSINNFLITSSTMTAPFQPTVQLGVQIGLSECQKQFKHSLWGCPTSVYNNLVNPSKRNRLKVTKEVAFIQAMVNAAIVHTIATTCQSGQHNNCSCQADRKRTFNDDQANKDNYAWLGCSNALKFAIKTTSELMDKKEGSDGMASINMHNSVVGRSVVQRTMRKVCRCHGLSGSCNIKSCWWKVNEFHKIGKRLKGSYELARKVEVDNMLRSSEGETANHLIYVEESPNYCYPNSTFGSAGTEKRNCHGAHQCAQFCTKCGYQIKEKVEEARIKCNCKFSWCCHVKCEACPPKRVSSCAINE